MKKKNEKKKNSFRLLRRAQLSEFFVVERRTRTECTDYDIEFVCAYDGVCVLESQKERDKNEERNECNKAQSEYRTTKKGESERERE